MHFLDDFHHHCFGYELNNLGSNFGLMVSVNYKTYYKTAIFDDSYLTMIGGLGAVACGLSRFFWGSIL